MYWSFTLAGDWLDQQENSVSERLFLQILLSFYRWLFKNSVFGEESCFSESEVKRRPSQKDEWDIMSSLIWALGVYLEEDYCLMWTPPRSPCHSESSLPTAAFDAAVLEDGGTPPLILQPQPSRHDWHTADRMPATPVCLRDTCGLGKFHINSSNTYFNYNHAGV